MTEQECLNKHRELWKNVALKISKEKRYIDKDDCVFPVINCGCYCCDYVLKLNSDCSKCPILWGKDKYTKCCSSLYGVYSKYEGVNYRKLAKIAYKISQLPPNYTLNSIESAIYWHRKMWNFIADTIKNKNIIPSKLDFIDSTIHKHIRYNCFLCAYARIKQDDPEKTRCEYCPVKWPSDLNCNTSDHNLYIKFKDYSEFALSYKDREKYLTQAYLCAKFIAKLPVKN